MTTRATPLPIPPFAGFMDHAEPVLPQSLPAAQAFSFDDVPVLTAALKRGDEEAFAWLHDQWSRRINRYSFAVAAGDAVLASEIAQAVWLRMVRAIRVLPDEGALWNWIACAARHAAIDLRRMGGRYARALGRFAQWWTRPEVSAEGKMEDHLLVALEAALQKLTDAEREMVEARYFTGTSLETIGTRHSLSERAVEGRLARLRQRLRELIAAQLRTIP